MPADRTDFLIKMYDQMFNDINTHILVVWQSVAVVVGAFALLSLAEKAIISVDLAAALIVLLSAWLVAHLYDASYWYNRNLVIIANIERQFLSAPDLKGIHYYFGRHRSTTTMLTHLKIQFALAVAIAGIFTGFHFVTRILPGIGQPWSGFDIQRTFPYLVLILAFLFLARLRRNRIKSYREFVANSPGIEVDTSGISYGVGHPTDDRSKHKAPGIDAR